MLRQLLVGYAAAAALTGISQEGEAPMALADLIAQSRSAPVSDPDATLVEQASQNSLATMIQKAKDAGLIKPGFEYGAPVVA